MKPDDASIQEWAREHVEIASESDAGVTCVLVAEDGVILDQTHIVEASEETEEEPGDDHHEQAMFTLVTRKALQFDESKAHVRAMGASVEIDVAVASSGVPIAVVQKLPNGGVLVSEAFTTEDDHYYIEPPLSLSLTTTTGVVRGYVMASKEYSAYEVQVGDNYFWIPVASFVSGSVPELETELGLRFGQIGGDFFVRQKDGSRLHVATALKLLQGWVDHASHNRAERFRVKRKPPEGDLAPLSYYARVVSTGDMAGVSFIISSLDKLVKITSGYSSWPHSAAFDEHDIFVQFTDYELDESGLYVRTARQSEQQALASVTPQIALKVSVVEEQGGGRLTAESEAQLLQLSLVNERTAADEIALVFPTRNKRSKQRQQLPMPFELDANRQLITINHSCSFSGSRQPSPGDVLLGIDGQHCTDASSARAELRESIRREQGNPNGGSVLLRLWKPPRGWTVPSPDDDKEDDAATDATEEDEALPEWTEGEMACLKRVCCRTIGGSKEKSNLITMCKALSIRSDGSHMKMQRRIEAELRRREFDKNTYCLKDRKRTERELPKHDDMRLTSEAISAKYSEAVFAIQQIAQLLKSIP